LPATAWGLPIVGGCGPTAEPDVLPPKQAERKGKPIPVLKKATPYDVKLRCMHIPGKVFRLM